MNQKDYTIRIALASLLVIAMALPIGLFTLQESTRLESQATSREISSPTTRIPGEAVVTPITSRQESGFNHCQVGGCNGELCADPARGPLNSICLWKEEFTCYRTARCEVQASGRCGWTLTDELRQCLSEHAAPPQITPPPITSLPILSPSPRSPQVTISPALIICDLICPDSFILTPDCQCLPPEPPRQMVSPDTIVPPVLNPSSLPSAINRQFYLSQIELSSPLEHSKLEVTVTGLPSGLSLDDCTPTATSFNRRYATCVLSGLVDSPGRGYPLVFTLSDGLGNTAIETRELQVLSQQTWLDRLFLRLRSLTPFSR